MTPSRFSLKSRAVDREAAEARQTRPHTRALEMLANFAKKLHNASKWVGTQAGIFANIMSAIYFCKAKWKKRCV